MANKTFNDVYQQISSIVNDTYYEFGNGLIVDTPYGIVVFNKYIIRQISTGYQVYIRTRFDVHEFGSAKNALVWIILDHNLKVNASKRVEELDSFIHSANIDSKIHSKLKNKAVSSEDYLIHSSKLQRDLEKQKQFLNEIDKYTMIARKCQQTRTTK